MVQRDNHPGEGWPREHLVYLPLQEDTSTDSVEKEINRGAVAGRFMVGGVVEEAWVHLPDSFCFCVT